MPTIEPKGPEGDTKVLVSRANGYIAMWLVRTLLERGYSVRGAVRSAEKGKHLLETFKEYADRDRFEIVVVEDITQAGAFDEAVKGVHAIEHTASPVHLDGDDPQDVIAPAVRGTVGILESALKYGKDAIRRIVITASGASILTISPEPQVFSELDWNEKSIQEVEEHGRDASPLAKYLASKTLAEKAAWEFYSKNKDVISWDLVTIIPPYVFGPAIQQVSQPSSLNASALEWYNAVVKGDGGGSTWYEWADAGTDWVDVRDLAEALVVALEKDEAGGERIIVSAGPFVWQDWRDVANSLTPSPVPSYILPKGTCGSGQNTAHMIHFEAAKATRILGVEYRSKEELTRDTLADFERRRWLTSEA